MKEEIRVHVVKRKGRKILALRYIDPISGRKVEKSAGTTRRREAERAASVRQDELRDGRYVQPSKLTWAEFRTRLEDEMFPAVSEKYVSAINTALNWFERLGAKLLVDINASDLSRFQAMLRKHGAGETTIRTHLKQLRAALSWAAEIGLLAKMPKSTMPKRGRKSNKMRGRPLVAEEYERM